jgi:lysine decarboxylase
MADQDVSPSARRTRRASGDVTPEQPCTPYLDAVVAYAFRGAGRWHVPGHKGGPGADPGLRHAIGDRALAADVPQDIRGIDVGPSPTPYEKAEALAAEAHGAARTWFLTNGATQGNHALCLALAPLGAPVVVQRNAHASVVDGLVLSGGRPTFVAPEYDEPLGMAHGVTADGLRAALDRTPGARAAFIVSPTYYGMVADVAACAEVAHAAGVPLVVDQAWGGHFGFHPDLPASALPLGADAVLTSTHKMAGSMTQSAMLHVGRDSRVDVEALARTVRLVRSTSPNSLLLGSLDAARRQLAIHGEAILHDTLAALRAVHGRLRGIDGVALVGEELVGRPGVAAWDPLRITLDVRGTGRSGFAVADALRQRYDIHPELATHAIVVLVVGPGENAATLDRLVGDLDETVRGIAEPGGTTPVVRSPLHGQAVAAVPPREAFLGAAEVVDVDEAVGRVSCESIAGYPPGIPALLPGEEITAETVRYLRELVADGARLHGASDPSFRRVTVLVAR